MKVICIDARPRKEGYSTTPLIEGNAYTVIGFNPYDGGYILQECKAPCNRYGSWMCDRFIPLSTIDETELIRERKTELV